MGARQIESQLSGPVIDGGPGSRCRFCDAPLGRTFVDLGVSPLCNSLVSRENLQLPESFYPLHVYLCSECFLVQLPVHVDPADIFQEYSYFSSYSTSWVEHARAYAKSMISLLGLDDRSLVLEIASNDGYLLQHFLKEEVPVLGIEPALNVAKHAERQGISTIMDFFDTRLAQNLVNEGRQADLIVGNNVLAQVPSINDFVGGIRTVLKKDGVVTVEFPHLMQLMDQVQFDTIYHEHFSYFSFTTAEKIFVSHDLTVFDVQELPTHGGSLRLYARHAADLSRPITERVVELRNKEARGGVQRLEYYAEFAERVREVKRALLEFLIQAKREGKSIAGYGAPGKGNTLLNYCGIGTDFIDYTVDRNPYKQGRFLPGSRVPILSVETIGETRPDYVLILPWNLKDEIISQMASVRSWGGQFVVPIPEIQIYK